MVNQGILNDASHVLCALIFMVTERLAVHENSYTGR